MAKAYLLLGGNSGDRTSLLNSAVRKIAERAGKVISTSSVYETQPWGFDHETEFFNQLVLTETSLSPEKLMEKILEIEKELGRVRGEKRYTERTMDIDILFYDDLVINRKNLVIPHPKLHLRRFALEPLAEMDPGLVHPLLRKSIAILLDECTDVSRVGKTD